MGTFPEHKEGTGCSANGCTRDAYCTFYIQLRKPSERSASGGNVTEVLSGFTSNKRVHWLINTPCDMHPYRQLNIIQIILTTWYYTL